MRRSTALTFEMIKVSNRSTALKALGLGALGAGALGVAQLASGPNPTLYSVLDRVYSQRPDTQRMFRQPIQLDSADPFTSVNNVRQRVVDANNFGNEISKSQPSTGFFDTMLDRTTDQYAKGNFALGQGYLTPDPNRLQRRTGTPLASF